jgi:8-oxo-dGTP pyrophosphatase MutT (NUDIX family)
MSKNKIRTIAIGIFIHKNRLLVSEGYDEVKGKTFFRPLGGGIKFGETGASALKREIMEEIGQEIDHISFLDFIENLFILNGEPGHEMVLVYSGRFTNSEIYSIDAFVGHEDDGSAINVKWIDISYFMKNVGLLVPPELLDIVTKIPE